MIAVILYHFGIPGFAGGFVGVDVFFVISGFLMTGIIVEGLTENQGRFGLLQFYLARAKRLVPALAVLCAVLLLLGWFYLLQADYATLSKHALSALGFYSNLQFLSEAGYFDAASYDKWLLHTWSLSVEWQFYLAFPLILVATWKVSPNRSALLEVILLLLLCSLTLSIFLSAENKTAAFYSFQTRAWELLAGSLLFMLGNKPHFAGACRNAIELTGFALIIASLVLFDASVDWPGWRALVPVTGTLLVLLAARQTSILTNSRVAQWVGDSSYSLYLWHWPIVAALANYELRDNRIAIAIGIVLTFTLGRLSYRWVEQKSRRALGSLAPVYSMASLLLAISLVVVPSLLIKTYEGLPDRGLPERARDILAQATNKNPRMGECHVAGLTPVPECHYGGDKLGVIVLGDSHASSIMRSVEKALPDKNLYVLDWSLASCLTIRDIKIINSPDFRCAEFLTHALTRLNTIPHNVPVIILNRATAYIFGPNEPDRQGEVPVPAVYTQTPYATRTPQYLQEMRDGIINTACEFAKDRPVYLLRPIPELKIDVPKTMVRRSMIPGKDTVVSVSLNEYRERNAFVWEAQNAARDKCGVKILDPTTYLCRNERCTGSRAGLPIYYDDDHLNERGGEILVPMFQTIFSGESTSNIAETRH